MSAGLLERLYARIDQEPWGCWNWLGAANGDGYGVLHTSANTRLNAHRTSYELHVGPIPEGLTLDHLCRNRLCVNPYHLQPVPIRENVLRSNGIAALNARKTHCYRGHPFNEENTIWKADGHRECRACRVERGKRKWREKHPHGRSTSCPKGHAFTEANTYYEPLASGRKTRRCKECRRLSERRTGGYLDPTRERPTHCPQGHAYTSENTYTYVRKTKRGESEYFRCRTCQRIRERAYKASLRSG